MAAQDKAIGIVDGLRTPIGSPHKSLKDFSAKELAAIVIKEILLKNKIKKDLISQVILGNVVAAGLGQNLSRHASILAGLPEQVVAYMVNNVCGAGLQSIILGMQAIRLQEASLVVAGGAESATHTPYLLKKEKDMDNPKGLLNSLIVDGLLCPMTKKRMGELAEGLVVRHKISRKSQDEFALDSHRKAWEAQKKGKFKKEIVPVETAKKIISHDDRPREDLSLKGLGALKTPFKKNGSITAGNASIPCDGAAGVVLGSLEEIKRYKLVARACILGYSHIMVNPQYTFESGVAAVKQALKKCSLSLRDIDLFEIGESFSSQAIWTKKELGIPDEKFNIWGGDIAFGHPLGAAGARILVTLLNALTDCKLRRGLAAISFGGGGAIALIIELNRG